MLNNKYLREKYNRMRTYSRLRLGIQQLIQKPYLNIFTLLCLAGLPLMRKLTEAILLHMSVDNFLFPIFRMSLHFIAIIFPLLLLVYVINLIGEKTAEKDEGHIIVAMIEEKMYSQPPILISKYKNKKTGVIIREFYSNQPLHLWEKNMESISWEFNSRFVGRKMEYGGKKHNKDKRIVTYMLEGRGEEDRGTLYE